MAADAESSRHSPSMPLRSASRGDGTRIRRVSKYCPHWCCGAALLLLCNVLAAAAEPIEAPTATSQPAATQPAADPNEAIDTTDIDDIELLDIEMPVVVTASRQREQLDEVAHAVSVITAEDIHRAGARTVPDALRLAVGVDVADLTFGNSAVAPRGFHGFLSRQVLVLVDGRQIYDSLFGGTLWGSWPLLIEDIERIEVIRGPGGVTWGANAVNGVVNIITKDPADQAGLTVTAGGGSRGWNREHIGYGFSDDQLRFRFSGEFEGSDGFARGGYRLHPLDDDYRAGRFNIKSIFKLNESDTLMFNAGHAILDGGYPRMPLAGLGTAKNPYSQASFMQFRWEHVAPDEARTELMLYMNEFGGSPGLRTLDYRYQQYALQFSHAFNVAAHRIRWGIDTRADVLNATNSEPFWLSDEFVSTGIIGFYVQDQWRFAPRWSLDLGARIDYEFYGGFQPSARAALSYDLNDDHIVYGAVSRAFQMSSVGLRHLDAPILNGLGRATANRSVDPETLIAYELGYRGTHFGRLHTSANLFWHAFDDLTTLSPRPGPPGLVRFHLDNRAAASLYGVELEARYNVTDALTLLGNYTYQQLHWRSAAAFHDKELLSPPHNKFMLGARYDLTDDWHLASHLYFVGDVDAPNPAFPLFSKSIDSYFRLDLMVEHEFWDDRGWIAVGVRNLTDDHHPEGATVFLSEAEVPRMFFAELGLRFK